MKHLFIALLTVACAASLPAANWDTFPAAGPLTGDETIPLNQSGTTKHADIDLIADFLRIETLTLTNKSMSGSANTFTNIPNSALVNSSVSVSLGTSGTDVNVSGSPTSLGGTLTINLPTASAVNRGLLSATDHATFSGVAARLLGSGSVTVNGASVISGTNTGDQTISLGGVLSGSGSGSITASFSNTAAQGLNIYSNGVTVSGAGTSAANGTYNFAGYEAGKPRFTLSGTTAIGNQVKWSGSAWIVQSNSTFVYSSTSAVDFPWLAAGWTATGGSNPAPTVAQTPIAAQTSVTSKTTEGIPRRNIRYAFIGDSITGPYVDQLSTPGAFPGFANGTIHNLGASGFTTANMVSAMAANLDPLKVLMPSDELYGFVLASSNDQAGGSVFPMAMYENLKTLWAGIRARGGKVIAFTPLPLKWATFTNSRKDRWEALTSLVLSDKSLYDYLVETHDIFPDASDLTYWNADGIHLNSTGYALLAQKVNDTFFRPQSISPNGTAIAGYTATVATGTVTLNDYSARIQTINPSGADRDVLLPRAGNPWGVGKEFLIFNVGAVGNLNLKTATGILQAVIRPGDFATLVRFEETWSVRLDPANAPFTITTRNIDLESATTTQLLPVPAGLKFVTQALDLEVTTLDTLTALPTVKLVESGSSADIIPAVALDAGLDAVREVQTLRPSVQRVTSGTNAVNLTVTVSGTATTLKADAHLTGYFLLDL